MSEPEILTLEEVRRWAVAAQLPFDDRFSVSREMLGRFCATVEHYAGKLVEGTEHAWYCERCDHWQDRRTGCEADIRFDERQMVEKEVEIERNRLRALVARMRTLLSRVLNRSIAWGIDPLPDDIAQLLADPDESGAKDREDAEIWRGICAQGRAIAAEMEAPEAQAEIAEKRLALDEAAEELEMVVGFVNGLNAYCGAIPCRSINEAHGIAAAFSDPSSFDCAAAEIASCVGDDDCFHYPDGLHQIDNLRKSGAK